MKHTRRIFALMAALLAFGLLALPAAAQSPFIRSGVDRDSVTTDEQVTFSVAVDSATGQPTEPVLPALDGFRVLNAATGTQISTVSGARTVEVIYQYVLQPLSTGRLVIGPVTVSAGGHSYQTDPITVEVTQGTGQPSPGSQRSNGSGGLGSLLGGLGGLSSLLDPNMDPFALLDQMGNTAASAPLAGDPSLPAIEAPKSLQGQDYLVEASVDNAHPYQGEQVAYTVRFYQAVNSFGQIDYRPPTFTGFWSKQEPEQKQYRTQAAGRNYVVSELRTVLFPTMAGEAEIDPTRLNVPGGFFDSGAELSSQPVTVNVKPLPAGAPPSFQGAVGQFKVDATLDKNEVMVGDTVTQQVRIIGLGNLETLADPQWPETPGWRAFDSKAETSAASQDGRLGGARTYNRTLIPTGPRSAVLPAIEFAYFDPVDSAYHTVSTDVLTIRVSPDAAALANQAGSAAASNAGDQAASSNGVAANLTIANSRPAIRPLKAAPAAWQTSGVPLAKQPWYWLLWTLPLLLLVAQYLRQRREAALQANPSLVDSRLAGRDAKAALAVARKHPDQASASAENILTSYLTRKLNRPVVGLTGQELTNLLVSEGVGRELAARTGNCLQASHAARYTPGETGESEGAGLAETEIIVDALEQKWRGGRS